MKKILLLAFVLSTLTALSGEKDKYFNFASGYMHKGYFSNVLSYEIEKKYHNALELYLDLSFLPDTSFFQNPSIVVGIAQKSVISRTRNQCFRLRYGADIGMANDRFKADINLGFEYSWYFKNGYQLFILQKNDMMLWSSEHLLKNGLMLGIKIPLNKY